jgi:hypothetical protein
LSARKLLVELLLPLGRALRHLDVRAYVKIPTRPPAELGNALAGNPRRSPQLHPVRNRHVDVAVERRDRVLGPEHGVWNRGLVIAPIASAMVTLFLCGDVMLARGIDQTLAEPCDPKLYEPHMDDARDYVASAEEASGPIPRRHSLIIERSAITGVERPRFALPMQIPPSPAHVRRAPEVCPYQPHRPVLAAVALLAACSSGTTVAETSPETSPIDRPTTAVWPAVNRWNERLEQEYAEFVETLGDAIESRRCHHLDQCLRDPVANTTYEPAVDAKLRLDLDCADLPYVLRAYFSFKRRLPFGFVAATRDQGRDPRYAVGIEPTQFLTWRDFPTPRRLLVEMIGRVHSGMYRIAPQVETGDLFPLSITRRAVRPGSIFYDPNGHVLVVARARPDGAVYMIDGHPDGSITWKRFGAAFAIGSARLGGGFKAFRPLRLEDGKLVQARNQELANFDASTQYDRSRHVVDGTPVAYHLWVRALLAESNAAVDPLVEFREQVRALCRDIADRVEAVDAAILAGIAARPHPGFLPPNIYGAEADWEIYSTPSRDARLKAAFRELKDFTSALPDLTERASTLRAIWSEEARSPACAFSYRSSLGVEVPLRLDAVLDRLFDLSFDPYHCPEVRWGAPAGSTERSACRDDANKWRWYALEARLRNRIDREYGVPTPLDSGPEAPPDVDVRSARP